MGIEIHNFLCLTVKIQGFELREEKVAPENAPQRWSLDLVEGVTEVVLITVCLQSKLEFADDAFDADLEDQVFSVLAQPVVDLSDLETLPFSIVDDPVGQSLNIFHWPKHRLAPHQIRYETLGGNLLLFPFS